MTYRSFAPLLAALALVASQSSAAPGIISVRAADMPAGNWRLDPAHASITVKLAHMGFSLFTLRFDRFDAAFAYDPAAPQASHVEVNVDPKSINTGQPALDHELGGEAWFDSGGNKPIRFVSTKIDIGDGHHGSMTGDLTIHGVTKPVTLEVIFNGSGLGLGAPIPRAGFSATAVVHKSEFGMTKYAAVLGDDVTIAIEAEFIRPPAAAAAPAK
jgi:polyisoprenoid-binding protein YceI